MQTLRAQIRWATSTFGGRRTQEHVDEYLEVLEAARAESALQKLLEENPILLAQFLRGGHGRWVSPQKRSGAEFIPDFIIGERHSGVANGPWSKLQSPATRLFPKDGRRTKQLDAGIRRILDWRRWLASNGDYARRSRNEHGLGLERHFIRGGRAIVHWTSR